MDNANPYLPPQADLSGETAQSAALDADQTLQIFIGQKYAYYTGKWDDAQRKGSIQSWNWPAFLFGFMWMAYRKMYKFCGIFIGFVAVETLIEIALELPSMLSNSINIAMAVCFGMLGNHLYRLHTEQKIREITAQGSPEQISAELSRQGGTSVPAVFGFIALLLLALFGILMLVGDI